MGTHSHVIEIPVDALHVGVLPAETQTAFKKAVTLSFLQEKWYLAGGTALALQVGHRSSEDLDFFTEEKDFDTAGLEQDLVLAGGWKTSRASAGTLYGAFFGARISFIAYPFFHPSSAFLRCGAIKILLPDDIAAMKIVAISQRGKKRDFIDLYWYLQIQGGDLKATILRTVAQFPGREHNLLHFFRSLTYFEDAEGDPMPRLHFTADWEGIKSYFRKTVPPVAKEMFGIA